MSDKTVYRVYFKDPDASVMIVNPDDCTSELEVYIHECPAEVRQWFEYDEYLSVEIDERGNIEVIKP